MTAINEGALTSMALCWRIERADGAGLGLTNHDQPLVVDGLRHDPAPGMTPASIIRGLGLEPHSGEVGGALSSDALDEGDLGVGRWNGAAVSLRAIDWCDPSREQIILLQGVLGDVSVEGERFTAELRGAASRLDGPVCPATSAECRAQFGDAECRVDLAGRTRIARIISAGDGTLVLDQAADGRFVLGRLRYLDGGNCGATTLVMAVDGASVAVRDLAAAPIEPGERVELREGCDKRFATCRERFQNAANFRGEPHLPGNDLLTRYPGA